VLTVLFQNGRVEDSMKNTERLEDRQLSKTKKKVFLVLFFDFLRHEKNEARHFVAREKL